MAKKETNTSQWVDERLAALNGGSDWRPDADRGLSRLRDRRRVARRHRMEWIAASFAGVAACVLAVIFFSPGACARSRTCASDLPRREAARPPEAALPVNFKEEGSPSAPIVCEIYSDYECPSCALLYKETVPLLKDQYVRTGKVRLLHRDYPLTQHPFARLAARYANAAGEIGQYDLVVNQIFQTQAIWSRDGNVDAQVMQVLPPGALQKVRELVNSDLHLDDTVTADQKMGAVDRVDHTPTVVIVHGGKRQVMPGVPQFPILKAFLDQLLAGH